MSREDPQMKIRLPEALKARIEQSAEAAGRSMNSEIIARLQATYDETVVTTVEARVKPGAEEKRFEFNADEIADKVAKRLEAHFTIAGGAEPLRLGSGASVVIGPSPEIEPHKAAIGPAPEQKKTVVVRADGRVTPFEPPEEQPRSRAPTNRGPMRSTNARKPKP